MSKASKVADICYQNINFNTTNANILRDISFTVQAGQCCALIGHNGAGKTTLIKLLLGMITPSSGKVTLCGGSPTGSQQKQIKSQIGFVPESVHFHPNYSGLEFMQYVAKLKSVSAQEIQNKLVMTNIDFAQHKKIGEYSKGMKQRLGLAQAMLGDPKVLILDEPASGLDPDSRLILYRSLQNHAKAGNTVMFSSHALNDIEPYIDHIVLLNEGAVLMDCGISEYRQSLRLKTTIEIEMRVLDARFSQELMKFGDLETQDNLLYLTVSHNKKLAALAFVSQAHNVLDIRLLDASLETIYHALLQQEEGK